MKKRFLSLLLTLCMVTAFMPTVALAAEPSLPTMYNTSTICANGVALIVEGTDDTHTTVYIDADRDGIRDDGELSLSEAGVVNAPADNIDLSTYVIFGGAATGTITGDSMITVNSGKVDDIYGGNRSGTNMEGGTTIVLNGGSIKRIVSCGYNNNVGTGLDKTVSVSIHGGTVRSASYDDVDLLARNNASTTSLLIDGGTINGTIAVKATDSSFIIRGGNILASIISSSLSPTDGTAPVYRMAITLKQNGTIKANTAVSSLTTDAGYTYGTTDVKTDANGQIFIYLPAEKTVTEATVAGEGSACTVKLAGSWGGWASLMPAILNTKNICGNGTALIVEGTDDTHTTVYIDADRDGVLDEGEQSLSAAGIDNAPADNIDLSSYSIYGGADIGIIGVDSMITINSGKVGDVYGGNASAYNMDGGTAIVMNGGNAGKIKAGGYSYNVGTGSNKTVSVSVHGGTVRSGLELSSGNSAANTSLFIDGGTINGSIAVKTAGGSFVVKGGSIQASTSTPAPTNGTVPVYKSMILIKHNGAVKANAVVSSLTTDAGYTYGLTDVKTDANGRIYVFLPIDKTVTGATVEGESTPCTVRTIASYGGLASLMPTMYNANTICANGTALIVDGTDDTHTTVYIDENRNGELDEGEKSLSAADVDNAPADNIDLSGYVIFGGAGTGTITDDSMITVNGGSVGDIYGANYSSYNMDGGTTIVLNSGSVKRIVTCGYSYNVGTGSNKTVSVSIHGGTIRSASYDDVDLYSRNSASTTSLLIDGGTINGSIAVKTTGGSCVIKGGNILASIYAPNPTNGTVRVYKSTMTLKYGETALANTAVSKLTTDAGYTYGMTDVITDAKGNLCVYLPADVTVTEATVDQNSYLGSVTTTTAGTAAGDLTSVAPIGTEIYANGTPIRIVAGTTANYTNILYDKDNDGTIGDTEYLKIGTVDPTAEGYDLSGYTIFGGKSGGEFDGDISVTMTGGKIRYLCGGDWNYDSSPCTITGDISVTVSGGTVIGNVQGGGNANVTGNITVNIDGGTVNGSAVAGSDGTVTGSVLINMTGGSVGTLFPCGPNANGVVKDGAASINISGGTVTGKDGRAVSSYGAYDNTAKSFIITGGSVKGSFDSAFVATPTNGGETPVGVYKTALTVKYKNNILLNGITISDLTLSSGTYGINDVMTDNSGNLYVYLPAGATVTEATADGINFTNSDGITVLTNGTANGTLTQVASLWTDGLASNSTAIFGGGTGTQADPYLLTSAEELAQLALNVNNGITYSGKYFRLTADIDLAGKYWVPIGNGGLGRSFRGILDGDNRIISNMAIDDSTFSIDGYARYGFISWMYSNAVVKNLGLENATVLLRSSGQTANEAALLVGLMDASCKMENCYATGTITALRTVESIGGLVGKIYSGGAIKNNCFNGTINAVGGTWVGGVLGCHSGGTPTNCYAVANITSTATYRYPVAAAATNCYYLADSETDSISGTTFKTAEQFADGTVAWLLNGQRSVGTTEDPLVWYQNIDNGKTVDLTPKLKGGTVYHISEPYTNVLNGITGFSASTSIAESEQLVYTDITGESDIFGVVTPLDGFTLSATPSLVGTNNSYCGTGTIITASYNGAEVEKYTLIVNGDITGDSFCDALDCMKADLALRGHYTPTSQEQCYYDVNRDGEYDISDYQLFVNFSLGV